MKKIVLSIVGGFVLIGALVLVIIRPWAKANGEGSVTIIVVDETEVTNKVVTFQKDDTLSEILETKFEAKYENSQYGAFITSVSGVTINSNEEYFAFYINNEYATTGVSSTPLNDGDVYKFEVTTIEPW